MRYAEIEADAEADANANKTVIDITPEEPTEPEEVIVLDPATGEVTDAESVPAF